MDLCRKLLLHAALNKSFCSLELGKLLLQQELLKGHSLKFTHFCLWKEPFFVCLHDAVLMAVWLPWLGIYNNLKKKKKPYVSQSRDGGYELAGRNGPKKMPMRCIMGYVGSSIFGDLPKACNQRLKPRVSLLCTYNLTLNLIHMKCLPYILNASPYLMKTVVCAS